MVIVMKKKGFFIVFLFFLSCTLFSGCANHKEITNADLTEFFQNNEVVFVEVANELYPLGLDDVNFGLKNNQVVEIYNVDKGELLLESNEIKTILLSGLQSMEQFLEDHYNPSSFSIRISTRKLYGEIFVLEFDFRNEKKHVDSGIVYTTEQTNENFIKLKDNWYLYSYGLV